MFEPEWLGPIRLIAAYAWGSGEQGNDRDGTFRQTGLQDNDAVLSGVTSFRYYGELLDPELANLHILTAGIGGRLSRNVSLELVGHRYRQDVATRTIFGDKLDRRPSGLDTDIG